jgi:hypothetical protein
MYDKLMRIQSKLKAPKNQDNKFGGYKYRSCEDILEAVKPLLAHEKLMLTISDNIKLIGDRYYIEAVATLWDIESPNSIQTTAYAREEETKKGMDSSQITGSASSYARKYALNGLFLIDDTKDADATNTHDKEENPVKEAPPPPKSINGSDKPATEKQLKLLYTLVSKKNYQDGVKSYIKTNYGKDSSKDLTSHEASELIELLNGME